MKSIDEDELAGEPGFEPGLTESESVGLPLTYSPTGALGRRVRPSLGYRTMRPISHDAGAERAVRL